MYESYIMTFYGDSDILASQVWLVLHRLRVHLLVRLQTNIQSHLRIQKTKRKRIKKIIIIIPDLQIMRIRSCCPLFNTDIYGLSMQRLSIYPSLFSTTEFLQRMSAFPLQYSPLAPLTKKKSTKAYESYDMTHTPNNIIGHVLSTRKCKMFKIERNLFIIFQ